MSKTPKTSSERCEAGSRKGISAVVSTVLVLMVSLAVISIFSGWAPNLVNDVMNSTGNQTQHRINCNEADLEIVSAKYWSSDNNVTAVVRNKGTMNFNGIRLEAWGEELPINATTTEAVNSSEFVTKNISSNSKPVTIEAISKSCSNARDKFEDIQ